MRVGLLAALCCLLTATSAFAAPTVTVECGRKLTANRTSFIAPDARKVEIAVAVSGGCPIVRLFLVCHVRSSSVEVPTPIIQREPIAMFAAASGKRLIDDSSEPDELLTRRNSGAYSK